MKRVLGGGELSKVVTCPRAQHRVAGQGVSGARCPVQDLEGADCWLLLQPMGSASHSKVSEIRPHPERMWAPRPAWAGFMKRDPG